MRDASSGSGHELPTAGSPDSNRQPPQLPTSNLTHELAQLLAASIARQQEARGTGVPTNAGLTSLASLVSAKFGPAHACPGVQGGLSSLSYSPPRPRPPQVAEPEPDELPDDDEPMPIPSTWRQPTYSDEERWYRQQMGAALLGLGAGLMIVVPTVLWLSGWLEPRKAKPGAITHVAATATAAIVDLRAAEVRTMKVQVPPDGEAARGCAQYVTGSIEPRAALETQRRRSAAARAALGSWRAKLADAQAAEARARLDDLLAQARGASRAATSTGAREMLAAAEEGGQGPVVVRAGRDLRSQHAGGLGLARRCGRRRQGQGPLPQGAQPRRRHAQNRLEALK